MRTLKRLKKIKELYLALFLILFVGFLFSSYSLKDISNDSIDKYMTLVVQHGVTDDGFPYQKLTFSNSTSETQSLFLIRSEMPENKRKRNFGIHATFKECRLRGVFDNSFLLKEIQKLNQDGWVIKQNNFSVGKSASESEDSPRVSETEYISYFLFEKKSN